MFQGSCKRSESPLRSVAKPAARRLASTASTSFVDGSSMRHSRSCASSAAAGRAPEDVVVEVSERAVGEGAPPLAAACAALREEGFALALDDVGTGRDGGEALARLRPDFLKVDASVVRGIDENLVKQEIFATIGRMGSAIGAAIVAVGVETPGEANTLRALGARYGQGYHFASPAPRERWVT